MSKPWNLVVEMPGYLSDSNGVLDDHERAEVVQMVATDPECGALIPKANLSMAERNALATLVGQLKSEMQKSKKGR